MPRFGVGLATADHAVPFQRSISVCNLPAVVLELPTAKQFVGLVHDAP